ncbi:hypothetical protein NKI34_31740 [Mesorhizobium sp. M0700]|uniref:hypothetical protein n=1 Tax=unclassified Mesorhizobium TaxID=325217 RepID=UPI00333B027D
MIVVVTDSDEATASNTAVCQHLHANNGLQLWGAAAVRPSLIPLAEAAENEPMLLVGHGSETEFLGNDGMAAVTRDDGQLLAGRTTIAIACKTGGALGRKVALDGGIWCGFEGPISCLVGDDDVIHHFRSIPDFFMANVHLLADQATATVFVDGYSDMMRGIISALEDLADTPRIEPIVAARWFRERLRVWLPAQLQPLEPEGASRPSLF